MVRGRAHDGAVGLTIRQRRGRLAIWSLSVVLTTLGAVPVAAQPPEPARRPPTDQEQESDAPSSSAGLAGRFSVHVNGSYQGGSTRLTDAFGYRAYGEDARFRSIHEITGGAMIDVGGSLRVWRRLSVGASYTQLHNSGTTTASGTVPHPIEFNNPRTIQPQSLTLAHRERATHVGAAWRFPIPQVEGLDVGVFGGPSFFNVTQGVVTNVTVSEAGGPPFASVSVSQVQTGQHRRNGVGGHVGADVTYMPTTYVGVGFLVRFAAASVDLPSAGSGTLSLDAGGIQTGGGIRFRF